MPDRPRRHKHSHRSRPRRDNALVPLAASSPHASLPAAVVQALDLALADERHALATYRAILKRFGEIRPFVNIARSEQRHIAALLSIYKRYGAPVPADPPTDPSPSQTLSIEEVCQIGVAAEIENVRLYDEELLPAVAAYPDISSVLHALRDASAHNHLPAFARCVSRNRHHVQSET